jgi:hypothetical protein
MLFGSLNGRFFAGLGLAGFMLAAAGCQSSDVGMLNVGRGKTRMGPTPPQSGDKVNQSDLLAYCPRVTLREGTAYYNTYARGGQDDPTKLVYQAAITDVTRDCSRNNGTLTMKVAVAGKVVPGPMGGAGTITMPIRIVVLHGEDVLYSKLHQYKLQIGDTSAATQFVFNDPNVSVPEPTDKGYQVFAGYDEGPPAAVASAEKPRPRKKRAAVVKKAAPPAPAQTSISDIPRE